MKIDEHAFNVALDATRETFPDLRHITAAKLSTLVAAYLDEIAPVKPARVEPKDNPYKRQFVQIDEDSMTASSNFGDNLDDLQYGIDLLCAVTHTASFNAGWYKDPKTGETIERNLGEVIALMHSELSEALEGARKGLMDDHLPHRLQLEVEFADTVIRIGDTCGHLGLDLAGAIVDKMNYNAHRLDHKLETRAAGGKLF